MNIAFVYLSNYSDWPMGGMLSYVKNIIPYMSNKEGNNLDIWGGYKDKENSNKFRLNDKEYTFKKYTNIHTYHKILPNFVISFFSALMNGRKFKNYDVIYSHTSATTIALKLMNPRICVIHHQHGLSYQNVKGFLRILNIGYKTAQLLSDATIFVASEDEVRKYQENIYFKNKHFWSMGSPICFKQIREKCQAKKQKDYIQFVYTGRLDDWKNIDLMIDAFVLYKKEVNNKDQLVLVGNGPKYDSVLLRIADEQLPYVHAVGRKEFQELSDILVESDIFLFPSKGEGVSLSLLEAFSAGLPAVSFDVIGVTNFVKDMETGIVVEDMNAGAYKDGIKKCARFYKNMGKNCVRLAEQYDADTIAEKIFEIINEEHEVFNA